MHEPWQTRTHAQRRRMARVADLIVGTIFMMLGLYVSFVSISQYQALSRGQVGPGVLPLLIGLTLILTSSLIMLRLHREAAAEADIEMPSLVEASRAGALLVLTVVTVILIPVIGALVALGLFGFVETTFLEKRGWRLGLLTAVLIPALLYVFFEAVLGVPLPAGHIGLL